VGISGISDSVSAVSEGYQLNYGIVLNLCGNQLISTQAAYVFVLSVFGENIPTAEF
jgi:hypothetical protein